MSIFCTSKHPIKAVIFDIDGVLYQSCNAEGKFLWSRRAKEDLGLCRTHFEKIFSPEWLELIRGKKSLRDHLERVWQGEEFQPKNGDTGSSSRCSTREYIDYWLRHDTLLREEVLALALNLKALGMPCYLGTNQEAVRTEHIRASLGVHFTHVFSSCDMGFIKPERGF